MPDPDELSAFQAQHPDPQKVLHRALYVLVPLRESIRDTTGKPAALTIRTLAEVLAAVDGLRESELLPVAAVNHDLWPFITELMILARRDDKDLDNAKIAQYLPFVLQAIKSSCMIARYGLPNDVVLEAGKRRRSVVTERLAQSPDA